MVFKISLLFILVIFSMFSVGYLCPAKKEPPPPTFLEINAKALGIKKCGLKYDPGPCYSKVRYISHKFERRYWYNVRTKVCELFEYIKDCGGNPNNFETYEECMTTCSEDYIGFLKNHTHLIDYKLDKYYTKFVPRKGKYWPEGDNLLNVTAKNSIKRTHETMTFKINLLFILVVFNIFNLGYLSSPILPSLTDERPAYCYSSYDSGPCLTDEMDMYNAFEIRFFYSIKSKDCFPFKYGGCGGNQNNFSTYRNCTKTCKKE
nr:PREDICTED: tissue factor pathway inhibitor-like [Linepithema humile]